MGRSVRQTNEKAMKILPGGEIHFGRIGGYFGE
jgi:hypothetical protein